MLTQHHRRSIRLQGYDYSQNGAYFVTLRTHNGQCLFGTVGANDHSPALPSVIELNEAGLAVTKCWLEIPDHFPYVELDAFVVMPNHVHGIISMEAVGSSPGATGANDHSPLRSGTSRTVGSVVRGFKIGVTKWFRSRRPEIATVWQRNYYEHIIRNDDDLNDVRLYIANNPARKVLG